MGNAAPRRLGRRIALGALTLAGLNVIAGVLPSPPLRAGRPSLPESVGSAVRTHDDSRLAAATSTLAGRRTRVRCWSPRDWERHTAELERTYPAGDRLGAWRAYTMVGTPPVVHFSPELCATLTTLATTTTPVRSDEAPEALAWSVAALAHEAMHASGQYVEANAECYGMQSIRTAATLLGRTRTEGEYLTALYWTRWYPSHDDEYRSPDCRDGGPLDLRRGSGVWP